jgi:hypothetical protein
MSTDDSNRNGHTHSGRMRLTILASLFPFLFHLDPEFKLKYHKKEGGREGRKDGGRKGGREEGRKEGRKEGRGEKQKKSKGKNSR